jgi:hypothetical protein
MNSVKDKQVIKILEYLLVLLITSYVFISNINEIKFHPDESWWISTSDTFDAFLSGDIESKVWEETYPNYSQPPVAKYIIGIGTKIGGFGSNELNKTWNFRFDTQQNIDRGAMPSKELLWYSRLPMAILATLSILIIFIIIRENLGLTAGYLTFGFFITNSYLKIHLLRAMGDSSLLFWVLIVILFSIYTFNIIKTGITKHELSYKLLCKIFVLFFILSFFIGLSGATKLNGFAIIFSTAPLIFLLFKINFPTKIIFSFIFFIALLIPSISFFTFVAVNPFLYSDPLMKTKKMVGMRLGEMEGQKKESKDSDLTRLSFIQRVNTVADRVFSKYSALKFKGSMIFNLSFFLLGFIIISNKSLQFAKGNYKDSIHLILLSSAISVATPSLFTPLDWDRYYLFPVVFSTVFICIGLAFLLMKIYGLLSNKGLVNVSC